ncbi:MAG: prepilin-type N-terminal cleavage/methylation domain-containing protein [Phycisphaerae bacterium]|nr:prepilin-type N-terminal cleavage/methylation domain-containing protein [Phycisphaerae bacterium]
MNAKKGFTLVEILIVVVILGILAAIVIPQFTNASTEAKENSLKSDLHTMRAQIELWSVKNSDNEPNALGDLVTDEYLRAIPENPFTNDATISSTQEDGSAWYYNSTTGDVRANDGGTDADSVKHWDY